MIHHEILVPPAGGAAHRRLTLVHGFTQNRRCWSPLDAALGSLGSVGAVDLPGHGRSGPPTGDLWSMATAVVAAAPADVWIGYSMGGRVLLHAALVAPTSMPRLVLIGAHPGIEDAERRRERAEADAARADHLEAVGLEPFLREWLDQPLFAGLTAEAGHLDARLDNAGAGVAEALRRGGTGQQEPLWDRLQALDMPVLYVVGERDEAYRPVADRTVAAIGTNAATAVIEGAGHAAHLERPEPTAAAIARWLEA